MTCDCKDWKENMPRIDSAVLFSALHSNDGIKESFKYCPYCGKELIDEENNL